MKNPDKVEAVSTNSDIFLVPMSGGEARNITVTNRGYEASPMYTPDGRYILYRSQKTEGFEADRWRIMRHNRQTGETVELTQGFDQQVDEMILSPDGKTVYFTAGERGYAPVFTVPLEPNFKLRIATHVKTAVPKGFYSNLNMLPDGKTLIMVGNSMTSPSEIYRASIERPEAIVNLSRANAALNFAAPEELEWTGAVNTKIHGYIVKPMNFDASKKYPMIVLIHGGPQGAWNNNCLLYTSPSPRD